MTRNMQRLLRFGLFVFVFSLSSACDTATEPTNCINGCQNPNAKNALKLSCDDGIISQLNISATDLECGVRGGCPGMTSDMLVARMSCYWKSTCNLRRPGRHPRDLIIKSDSPKCFGRFAKHLKVNGFRCFSNSSEDMILDVMECSSSNCNLLEQRGGLLRSHLNYPAMFLTPKPQICCTKFAIREDFPYLVLTFQDIDLGDGDSLKLIAYPNGQSPNETDLSNHPPGKTTRKYLMNSPFAEIRFKGGDFSNGGRGFVLCFRFVAVNDPLTDACDAVSTEGKQGVPTMVSDSPHIFLIPGLFSPIVEVDQTQEKIGTTTVKPKPKRKGCKNKGKRKCRGKKNRDPRKRRKCKKDKGKKCRGKKGKRGKRKKPADSAPSVKQVGQYMIADKFF